MSRLQNKQLGYPLSGSFTGSLFGTASYAVTASHVTNTGSFFLINGNTVASDVSLGTLNDYSLFLIVSGSTRLELNNTGSIIIAKNQLGHQVASIDDSGIFTLATQSAELSSSASYGAFYFTSGSLFVGLD